MDEPKGGTGAEREWLTLELPNVSNDQKGEGLEDEISAELRRIRMASEYNRQVAAGRAQRSNNSKAKKSSSAHRRFAAASDEYQPPPSSVLPGHHRVRDFSVSSFGQQRRPPPQGYGDGSRSFWQGLYDRVSVGGGTGRGGRRQVVVHDDADDDGELAVPENPSWKHRATFSINGSPQLEDGPPRSMVVLSRGPLHPALERRPGADRALDRSQASLSPEDVSQLSPMVPVRSPTGALTVEPPSRPDSFMQRAFMADVATSSEGHTPSSEVLSSEIVPMVGGPWLKSVPMGGRTMNAESGPSQGRSLITSSNLPPSSRSAEPAEHVSRSRSSRALIEEEHHSQNRSQPRRRTSGAYGPPGLVMPSPLSPARFSVVEGSRPQEGPSPPSTSGYIRESRRKSQVLETASSR